MDTLWPFFFTPKHPEMGQFGFQGLFPRGAQEWINVVLGLFFIPETLRNGQICTSGPFFLPPERFKMDQFGFRNSFLPPKHTEMGQFGFQGLFLHRNTQKWVNLDFRAFILFFTPRTLRNGQIQLLGPLSLHRNAQKWVSSDLRAFFTPKTLGNGSIWL